MVPANAHFVLLGWFAFGVAADGFGRFTRCVFCSDFHGQFVMTLLFRRSYGWHIQLGQDDFFVLRLYRRFPTTEIRWRQLRFVLLLTLFEPFHSLLTSLFSFLIRFCPHKFNFRLLDFHSHLIFTKARLRTEVRDPVVHIINVDQWDCASHLVHYNSGCPALHLLYIGDVLEHFRVLELGVAPPQVCLVTGAEDHAVHLNGHFLFVSVTLEFPVFTERGSP